jgi:MscS family membrane protein
VDRLGPGRRPTPATADEALTRLVAGNERFRDVTTRLLEAVCLVMLVLPPAAARAQTTPAAKPPIEQPAAVEDSLGRRTPRGTVRGFLSAARKGDDEIAAQYLNTRLQGDDAEKLAHQLFIVLDTRLPARLAQLSTDPEGSSAERLKSNLELVGAIATANGDVDITLERVTREKSEEIWLFSRQTLEAVPEIYEEISLTSVDTRLPEFLTRIRVVGVRLFDWLTVLLGLPLLYLLTVLLDRLLSPLISALWLRLRRRSARSPKNILPTPVRLLFLGLAIRWLASSGVQLPLMARQVWFSAAMVIGDGHQRHRHCLAADSAEHPGRARGPTARARAQRGGRGLADPAGKANGRLDCSVRGVPRDPAEPRREPDPGPGRTWRRRHRRGARGPEDAGERQRWRVADFRRGPVNEGDFLKVGETLGEVEHVGLRSTRLRTLDRTIVSVPNSQIASMSVETLSARDTYWFHPVVGLRYETTTEQLRRVLDGIRRLLTAHPLVDQMSIRVRFIRLGSFSLDVDVFAYLRARDWNHFLEIQEQLLFSVMNVVQEAGTEVAFPSQTLYMASAQGALSGASDFRQSPDSRALPIHANDAR